MTEININKHIYLYGKFYDTSRVKVPTDEQNWTGIIIYTKSCEETNRVISSLEGFFVSEKPVKGAGATDGSPLVQKTQMQDFEQMYQGKFIPFKK